MLFWKRQHVANRRHDDMLNVGVGNNFLQKMGIKIHDHQGFAIGITKLMFHFAIGVKRIGVDDDHSGLHCAKKYNRVLQEIWHLNGDAIAFFKFADI